MVGLVVAIAFGVANWLALIDRDQKVTAVPLPPGPDGERVFTKSRGNQDEKYDFDKDYHEDWKRVIPKAACWARSRCRRPALGGCVPKAAGVVETPRCAAPSPETPWAAA